jgi:transposase InsO family protein
MPWKETGPMDQRLRFIAAVSASGGLGMTEACQLFGISRKSGYKWLDRYKAGGPAALADRSRAPKTTPWAVDPKVSSVVVAARKAHPTWGPVKLLDWLTPRQPNMRLPAPSSVGDLLKRRGLVTIRKRRMRTERPKKPLIHVRKPNDLWSIDFKGHFLLGNGQRCGPLTITDSLSRSLLCCRAMSDHPTTEDVQPAFERICREFGLPSALRSDNGTPFASRGLARLSRLSVWWVKLGIALEHIDPGRPDQNGRHERMHRTLKEEATIPPSYDERRQQLRFDHFQREFNSERPHEALQGRTPNSIYLPSTRPFPDKLREIEYPSHYTIRMVRSDGTFKWKGENVFCSDVLYGEPVGLEEIADGRWLLSFDRITLAILDDRRRKPRLLPVG